MKKIISALLACTAFWPVGSFAERILVAGDSITGHSMNLSGRSGYYYQFMAALRDAGVDGIELVPLGGSGQTVGSWRNVVKESRQTDRQLDIRGIFVKKELDRGCDTLVIFLGMNDALSPTTGLDRIGEWKRQYQQLIDDLKARLDFRRLVLASPTMCTENPGNYRNRLMARMDELVAELAAENGAVHARVWEEFGKFWRLGRMSDPAFRLTNDYVHPNRLGHAAITVALLRAVGQEQAADSWYRKVRKELGPAAMGEPGMLLYMGTAAVPGRMAIHGEVSGFKPETVVAVSPGGLKTAECRIDGNQFILSLQGELPHSETLKVIASAGEKRAEQTLRLHPPFLVAAKLPSPRWFRGEEFQTAQLETPIDRALLENGDFLNAPVDGSGKRADWRAYYPGGDVVGGDDPGSVDFASCDDSPAFAQGFMVRYVHHETGGKARLRIGRRTFAATIGATVYLNGKRVFRDFLKENSYDVEVELAPGWNLLAARCSHVNWQFQLSVSLNGIDGLRYSIKAPFADTATPHR